jgi:hypothetical protein
MERISSPVCLGAHQRDFVYQMATILLLWTVSITKKQYLSL